MKIRTRIALWITLAGLGIGLSFSMLVYLEFREQAYRTLDHELKATIRDVYRVCRRPGPAANPVNQEREAFFMNRKLWIRAWRGDRPVYSSPLATRIEIPASGPRKENRRATTAESPPGRVAGQPATRQTTWRVRRALIPATAGTPAYRIVVARPMDKLDEELNEVLLDIGLGVPGAVLLLTLISWLMAGRILRPLREITARAREIDEKGLADRLPTSPGRDEIHELAAALNQMLDRLQYSFRRQQEFLAAAAHELNTPLSSLRLASEQALAEPGLEPELQKMLTHQHDTLLRMGRLLRSLIMLSTLEIQPRAEFKPLDLCPLLRSVLADLEPLIELHRLRVSTGLPTGRPLNGDEEKLRRVLINLVENAIKYNIEGGELSIELRTDPKARTTILEIVNQVARPLPEDARDQLFEQFYRVEKSRSREYGGCGLGLTIVKEIVSLHKGSIRLENRPPDRVAAVLVLPDDPSAAS